MGIEELPEIVEGLNEEDKGRFDGMFEYDRSTGEIVIPESFEDKVHSYLSVPEETMEETVARASKQAIIHTANRYSGEQALFNELRTSRPGYRLEVVSSEETKKRFDNIHEDKKKSGCDFCEPELFTSLDLGERLRTENVVSGANLALYDKRSGLLILKEPNPLRVSFEAFCDCIDIAKDYFYKMHERNPAERFALIGWNCSERAAASQPHAHMQLIMNSFVNFEDPERSRMAAERFRSEKHKDYFSELSHIHQSIGAGFAYKGASVFSYLAPRKDKETWVIASSLEELKEPAYKMYKGFVNDLGVAAFNFVVQMRPIGRNDSENTMPYIAKMVDRGNPFKNGSDIGFMEMYGTPVIGSDPFKVADVLRKSFENL